MFKKLVVVLMGVFLVWQVALPAERKVLHCGKLLDVDKGQVLNDVSVVVENGVIKALERGAVTAADAERIDLASSTCSPGFIDLHVHVAGAARVPGAPGAGVAPVVQSLVSQSLITVNDKLEDGFTTLRLLGDDRDFESVALRDAINAGVVKGPRLLVAADIYSPAFPAGAPKLFEQNISGEAAARDAVRLQAARGADWVKLVATVGVGATREEIDALVDEARKRKIKVAIHANPMQSLDPRQIEVNRNAFRAAVLAHANSIEHGVGMNDDDIRLLAENHVWLVPTLAVLDVVVELSERMKAPELLAVARNARAIHPGAVKRAYEAGVGMGLGSDFQTGPMTRKKSVDEFVAMMSAIGDAWFVMKAGTINGARILGLESDIGSIAVGKRADIVAMPANPIEDMSATQRVDFVMRDGEVFRNDRLAGKSQDVSSGAVPQRLKR